MTLCRESVVDQTVPFSNAFVRKNVAYSYDVVTFKSLQPTPFYLEKSSVGKQIFQCFSSVFSSNVV